MGIPIYSMTGYGRAGKSGGGVRIEIELRTVNHRFLDLNARLPREYLPFEAEIKSELGQILTRGRVDLYVTRTLDPSAATPSNFNEPRFKELLQVYRHALTAAEVPHTESHLAAASFEILRRSDVLEDEQVGVVSDEERRTLCGAVRDAGHAVQRMRMEEGARLGKDLAARLSNIESIVDRICQRAVRDPEAQAALLKERVTKLVAASQIEPSRLAQEVAFLADRSDVTEELVRLRSHIEQFRLSLEREPNGKRFDFLLQEMGRECNTIASKAQDAAIQNLVIDAKLELEKMREQTQNLE